MSAVSNTRSLRVSPPEVANSRPLVVAPPAASPTIPLSGRPRSLSAPASSEIRQAQAQCLQVCLGTFFREQPGMRSMGFTSAVGGEGKTLLALLTSSALAAHTGKSVFLVDAHWDRPRLHQHYGLPATPGLAEWLRQECRLDAICHRVDTNLTIVPAGAGQHDAIALMNRWREVGLLAPFDALSSLGTANSLVLVDLPPLTTSTFGMLGVQLPETLMLVVRAGATPDHLVAETCAALGSLRIEGVVLNQVRSRIPRWLRRLL